MEFSELGLVVVDEQHRFGVAQRLALRQKGRDTDLLVMTATPIPRSLALTLYGDLDVSVIDRLPAGRKPISTHLVPPGRRADLQRFLAQRIEAGERVFVVCPRIEASEEEDAPGAAEEWFARYRDEILPQFRVVLLHGRLPSVEKERAMRAFESGEAQVLVGTTVIEVGVDVPAATVMVIEGAERFGLSQLHQLREESAGASARAGVSCCPARESGATAWSGCGSSPPPPMASRSARRTCACAARGTFSASARAACPSCGWPTWWRTISCCWRPAPPPSAS